jgi:hypothetical protein
MPDSATRNAVVRTNEAAVLAGHAWALWVLAGSAGVGLVLSMAGAGFSIPANPLPAVVTAALICGASLAAGGLLGFLFGIPRTPPESRSEAGSATESKAEASNRLPYLPNTNLEQISDWLTKILVGVGLTQIGSLPLKLDGLAEYTEGCFAGSKAMALAVLVYFNLAGFLIGFLWTRLYLPRALRDADLVEKLEAKVDNLQRAKESEQQILSLIEQQLSADAPPLSAEHLTSAIMKASRAERSRIFYRAAAVRTTTWRDPVSKPVMERTIPIFRALIQADPNYYRTHGQLGFALKDATTPQWREALDELTAAINLRNAAESTDAVADNSTDGSLPWYEYVRAQCRIALDPEFKRQLPSDDATRKAILADINAAKALGGVLLDDPEILRWLGINGVSLGVDPLS